MVLCAAAAAAPPEWSQPVVVFRTEGWVSHPLLVGDSAGDLHLFLAFSPSRDPHDTKSAGQLLYLRRDPTGWQQVTEVLSSPGGGLLQVPAVALDAEGWFHVVWSGGSFSRAYYSRAHLSQAATAAHWSAPQVLSRVGPFGGTFRMDILASADGMLHFVYASREGSVYYRVSHDGGDSWADEVRISSVEGGQEAADYPRIARTTNGGLHVVWTQFRLPDGWPPAGAYYSRSLDGGATWSQPRRVAGENYGQLNLQAIGSSEIHLLWHGIASVGDRLHQWSGDGGESWGPIERISVQIKGGLTGYSAMAVDSALALHVVTSVAGQEGRTEDVYHLVRRAGAWSEPRRISQGAIGKQSVELPALAVSEGNHLHAVYEDDFERVWYTECTTDAAAVPARPVATPRPMGWRETMGRHQSTLLWSLGGLSLVAAVIIWRLPLGCRPVR